MNKSYAEIDSLRLDTRRKKKRYILVVGIFCLSLSFKIWVSSQYTNLGYKTGDVRDKIISLSLKRQELELQKTFLLRADRIKEEAKTKLGMVNSNPLEVMVLKY